MFLLLVSCCPVVSLDSQLWDRKGCAGLPGASRQKPSRRDSQPLVDPYALEVPLLMSAPADDQALQEARWS